jgi:hypothetical protein
LQRIFKRALRLCGMSDVVAIGFGDNDSVGELDNAALYSL